MAKTFNVRGRELEVYQLKNDDLLSIYNREDLTDEDRKVITAAIVNRFKYDLCPNAGEDTDDVFARFFGNYVNGKCNNKQKVGKLLCREHRYLQNEMFKVCLEYIKKLAENFENNIYDPRNQYAAQTAKKMIDALKEQEWPY